MSIENNKVNNIPELSLKKNFLGNWSSFFIKRYRVTFLLVIAILIWGATKYTSLQKEAQPKVTIPFGFVNTIYIGAAPEEIETLVTKPIEEKLDELDDVKRITSTSGLGYSSVVLEFEQGVNVEEKIREAKEKLSGIDSELPEDAETPVVLEMKTGQSPVVVYSLSGNDNIIELQEIAKKIQKEIELVDGVKEVNLLGNVDREITIAVDPKKLPVYGISLQDIKNAISSSNINFPGGDVELNGKNYNIRTVGKFEQIDEIGNVVVKYNSNGQVYLKDIAVIKDGYEDVDIIARKSYGLDLNEKYMKKSIVMGVKRKDNADEVKIRDDVFQMIKEKEDQLIPNGFKLELLADKADYVDKQLGSVTENAVSGLCLVIIVLFLFIGFEESLIVSFVIPLSIFSAFGLLKVSGNTLNNISMFSLVLAVGMLVDNAIVVMENIDRLRNKGLSAKEASLVATNQIAPAILASTLTTLAAFFPMILTSGIMGDFIRPIPMTVIFTLVSSFFMAITVTPSICSIVLKRHNKKSNNKSSNKYKGLITKIISIIFVVVLSLFAFKDWEKVGLEQFTLLSWIAAIAFGGGMTIKQFKAKGNHEENFIIRNYSKMLYWIVSKLYRKILVIVMVGILFIGSIALIPLGILKVEMFGAEDFPTLYVNIKTPIGTNINDTLEIAKEVEAKLFEVNEIKYFTTYIGNQGADIYSDLADESAGVSNESRIIMELVEAKDRERTSTEIAKDLRNKVKSIVGAEIKINELASGPPSGAPLYIKLKGENLEDLKKTARYYESVLKTMDGIREPRTSIGEGSPELQVKVNKAKAAALGLDDMSIALSVRNATHGLVATTFSHNQEEIDVIIQTSQKRLETVHDLENIYFYNRRGEAIPFTQVAEIIESESVQGIEHEDGKRLIYVAADIDGTAWTAAEATASFEEKVANYPLPEGISKEYGGEMEAMGDSFGDMMLNMVIAAILVYIILAVQFNSLSQPMIILFTVPMAIIGVMPGLVITGYAFGFVAFIGLVALVGIAVNDAIVLVDYINYLRSTGYEMKEAIKETGITRFIPVMATTITTAGGILPITLKDPFFAPMGVALISGLCMATVLTLVIVPTMYSIFEGFKLRSKSKKEKKLSNQAKVAIEI